MKLKKFICAVIMLTVVFSSISLVCFADSPSAAPYYSYELNKDQKSVAAPEGFIESKTVNYQTLGLDTAFNTPRDFVATESGFFILDSGNGRIVELDKNLNFVKVYDTFVDDAGEALDFTGAKGMDIDVNGNFVIADYENERVVIIGKDGVLKDKILRPDAVLENNEFPFSVNKVKCAANGDIYVNVETMNLGIFVFDSEGRFDKFVANNPVVQTGEVIMEYLYRAFLTTEQIRNRVQSTPLTINNFCLADNGFMYTVSQNSGATQQAGMVRCMNYTDSNVINPKIVFGDLEVDSDNNKKTSFTSVDITDDGNIVLLDAGRGKVFYYSNNGYLITVFGGHGQQVGTFTTPVEVRTVGDKVYVLDSSKGCIVEFIPTDYFNTYRKALNLLKERKFDESLEAWKEVNLLNSNSEYAYYGMGLVYDMRGDFKNAMKCFKLANDRTSYSNAFEEYRMQWLAENLLWIILAVVAIIAVVIGIKAVLKRLQRTNGTAYSEMETKYLFPLYTMRHPVDGFEQFKVRDVKSVGLASGIIIFWFAVSILSKYATGFIYNTGNKDFNPIAILVATIGLYVVFVVANWCVASFLEGKGTFTDIVCAVSYSLLPYVITKALAIPLSNILTEKEAVFISIVTTIGLIWTAFLMLGGLYAIHQYSFSKTLVSVILTVLGMIVIVFVLVIFYSLIQQAFGFLESLYQEITL